MLRCSRFALISIAALAGVGAADDRDLPQAEYDRQVHQAEKLLIAAGDADSLAAAAMLSVGPKGNLVERLTLITRAVSNAPNRPDLVWLNIRLCAAVDSCDSGPLEARLRALDPDNGAAWFDAIGRAQKRNDGVEIHSNLQSIARSKRFDFYWNGSIARITNAIVSTHTFDLPTALVATIGMASATTIPPFQSISKACKGDALLNPEMLSICQKVSEVMRSGDTYITELVGVAIAKRTWSEGNPQYIEADQTKRMAHYRIDTAGKLGVSHLSSNAYVANLLQLMTEKRTEQEVVLAEISSAGMNPDPPSDWTDR